MLRRLNFRNPVATARQFEYGTCRFLRLVVTGHVRVVPMTPPGVAVQDDMLGIYLRI